MPAFSPTVFLPKFLVSVLTPQGGRVAGAAIRVLLAGVDKTPLMAAGNTPGYTDASGNYTVFFLERLGGLGPLPANTYQISVSAAGYQNAVISTAADFTGVDTFAVTLTPTAPSAPDIVPVLASGYVSALQPVETLVGRLAPGAAWELITASITGETGAVSKLEVPVSGDLSRVNLQARLRLKPIPHLVGDADPAVMDIDFTQAFTVGFSSLTESGENPISTTLSLKAANCQPLTVDNDLTNYTNRGTSGLADWITQIGRAHV